MSGKIRRVACIFGTRPEAIKMAPVVLGLRAAAGFEPVVVVTGQHREMLDQVLEVFGIVPDHDLDIQQPRQTLTGVTTNALAALDPVLDEVQPDVVMVQGDTTTTMVGALAAFYRQVPVAHLEAGLRTGDRYSPFPEEINRRLTTQLASLHLAPTPLSASNLKADGVSSDQIVVTGNSVIDALHLALVTGAGSSIGPFEPAPHDPRRLLLVTAHRRESWGEPMRNIGRALRHLALNRPDLLIAFPIHRNPVVREAIEPAVAGLDNVVLGEPLAYGAFCELMSRADVVLTDSGGVQEEAPALGKPVLVMRDTTERPEAVEFGTARVVGTEERTIIDEVERLLDDSEAYDRMATAVNPYGDGRATQRTIAALSHLFGEGDRPDDFVPAVLVTADGR